MFRKIQRLCGNILTACLRCCRRPRLLKLPNTMNYRHSQSMSRVNGILSLTIFCPPFPWQRNRNPTPTPWSSLSDKAREPWERDGRINVTLTMWTSSSVCKIELQSNWQSETKNCTEGCQSTYNDDSNTRAGTFWSGACNWLCKRLPLFNGWSLPKEGRGLGGSCCR